jgi:hypothetical protein
MSGYFLCHLALLAASLSRPEEAAQMLGYAEAWFTANQYTREPSEELSLRLATEAVEARLEAAQIKALGRTGAVMNEAQALALTHETLGEAGQSEPSRSEPVPVRWTPRSTMSVIHGRPVRSPATNREPAVGG